MTNEILVIDDNPDIRRLISGILKDKGFVVREAANFDQAMLEINKKLPDVAIIDVKLDKGDNDGIELLVHLKRIDDDVPVHDIWPCQCSNGCRFIKTWSF